MNSVGPLQKGPGIIRRRQPVIRKVTAKPSPTAPSSSTNPTIVKPSNGKIGQKSGSVNGRTLGTSLKAPNRVLQRSVTPQRARSEKRKRASPAQIPLESNSEGSSSDGDILEARKRPKNSVSAEPDLKRRIRSLQAFSEEDGGVFDMIHAESIASANSPKYEPALGGGPGQPQLLLQYPSASQHERYDLVRPRDKDDFKPIDDIVRVIELVSNHYVPHDQVSIFTDETTGILRKLQRAQNWREADEFRKTVNEYNEVITKLRQNGTIAKNLDNVHSLGLPHVEAILTQVYARTVSLQVEKLRRYDNGTDNVYGELLPRFVSRILKQTKLKSNQVFVDMGSGVGNVVLQAALEFGCESWGCEEMEAPCKMANLQHKEFKARCRLWGLAPGEVHLERGDFIESPAIQNVLKRADVLLINNQAFLPQLNEKLVRKFLDLKEGCQVVSLKPFEQITKRNYGSIMNQFKVDVKEYFSGNVSWTDAPGTYYIHTKDSSRVKEFPTELE